jgi:histidinol-phosphate aminotransferase
VNGGAVSSGPVPAPRPHILSLAPYALADLSVAGRLRAIHLAQNENATPPGAAALQAVQAAMANINRYPEGDAGTLRHAIAAAENLSADRIVCGAGSMELLALLAQAYLGPGDEVVVSEYGYIFFRTVTELAGARFVLAPEREFSTDIDAMLSRVGPRTCMMFLANPNNPTGSLLSRAALRSLRASLRGDIILVIDAAYSEYVTEADYESGAELVDTTPNTVMIRTFSKIHGLAGLRVGWGYFPAPIAQIINRVRHPNNVSGLAIAAATAAIADRAHVAGMRRANADLRTWFTQELRQMGLVPRDGHGNFVLLPFASPESAAAARQCLKTLGVVVRPMPAYGLDQCLRITLGTQDELCVACEALQAFSKGGRP